MELFKVSKRNILTVTVILTTTSFILILFFSKSIPSSLLQIGTIVTIVTLFWIYFEKIGWHCRIFRVGGWLSNIPDIRGRWEGNLRRDGEANEHKFILEITQTASKVKVSTYSAHSSSYSIISNILFDQTEDDVVLIYTWLGSTSNPIHGHEPGNFYGTSILRLNLDNPKKLKGEYYTNRRPQQTQGKLELEWKQLERRGEF